jgi:hypothetical protein
MTNRGKFRILSDGQILFMCPGCKRYHGVYVTKEHPVNWDFNGDYDKPTINPSILVTMPNTGTCHSFIKDGKIQFLNDCYHTLAGQTVDLINEDDGDNV